jgi:hypothetical protein
MVKQQCSEKLDPKVYVTESILFEEDISEN